MTLGAPGMTPAYMGLQPQSIEEQILTSVTATNALQSLNHSAETYVLLSTATHTIQFDDAVNVYTKPNSSSIQCMNSSNYIL